MSTLLCIWDYKINSGNLYIIISHYVKYNNCRINTHYIHSVLVQDFVSGQTCCVSKYHYESHNKGDLIPSVLVQDFVSGQACCVSKYHYESYNKGDLIPSH